MSEGQKSIESFVPTNPGWSRIRLGQGKLKDSGRTLFKSAKWSDIAVTLERKVNSKDDYDDPDFTEVHPNTTVRFRIYSLTKLPILNQYGGDKDGFGVLLGDIDVNQCEVVHHAKLRERFDLYFAGNVWSIRMCDEESGILWVRAIFASARNIALDSVFNIYKDPLFSSAVFAKVPLRVDHLMTRLRSHVVYPPVSWKPSDFAHPCEFLDPGVLLASLMRGLGVNVYRYYDIKGVRCVSKVSGIVYYVPNRGALVDTQSPINWITKAEDRKDITRVALSDLKNAFKRGRDQLEELLSTYRISRSQLSECAVTCGGGGTKLAIDPKQLYAASQKVGRATQKTAIIDPDFDHRPQYGVASSTASPKSSGATRAVEAKRALALDPLQREIFALAGHEEKNSGDENVLEEECQFGAISFCSELSGGDEDFLLPIEKITKVELLGHSPVFQRVGTTPHLFDCCISVWFSDGLVQKQIAETKAELRKCVEALELIYTPGASLASLDLPADTAKQTRRRSVAAVPGQTAEMMLDNANASLGDGSILGNESILEENSTLAATNDGTISQDDAHSVLAQDAANSTMGDTQSMGDNTHEIAEQIVEKPKPNKKKKSSKEQLQGDKHPDRIEMNALASRIPRSDRSLVHINWKRRRTVRRKVMELRSIAKASCKKIEELLSIEFMALHFEFPSQGAAVAWITALHYLQTLRKYEEALKSEALKAQKRPPLPVRVKIGAVIPPPPAEAAHSSSAHISLLRAKEEAETLADFSEKIKSGAFNYVALKSDPPCKIPKGTYFSEGNVYQEKNNVLIGALMFARGPLPFRSPKTGKEIYQIKDPDSNGEYLIATDGFIYDPIMRERIGKLEIELDPTAELLGEDGLPIMDEGEADEEDDEDGGWFEPGGGAAQAQQKKASEEIAQSSAEIKGNKAARKMRSDKRSYHEEHVQARSDKSRLGPKFLYDEDGMLLDVPAPITLPPGTFFNPPYLFQSHDHSLMGRLILERYLPFPSAKTDWQGPIYEIRLDTDDGFDQEMIIANDGNIYDAVNYEVIGEIDTSAPEAEIEQPQTAKKSKKRDSKSTKGDSKSKKKDKKGKKTDEQAPELGGDMASAIEAMNALLAASLPPELQNEIDKLKSDSFARAEVKYQNKTTKVKSKRKTKERKVDKNEEDNTINEDEIIEPNNEINDEVPEENTVSLNELHEYQAVEPTHDTDVSTGEVEEKELALEIDDLHLKGSSNIESTERENRGVLSHGFQDATQSVSNSICNETENLPESAGEDLLRLAQASGSELIANAIVAVESPLKDGQTITDVTSINIDEDHSSLTELPQSEQHIENESDYVVPKEHTPVVAPAATATGLRIRRIKRSELKNIDAQVVENRTEVDETGKVRKVLVVRRKRASVLPSQAPFASATNIDSHEDNSHGVIAASDFKD